MARKRDIKKGSHLYNDRTGDYLGVARAPVRHDDSVVYFDGPRMRDGLPVTWATYHEVTVGPAPTAPPDRPDRM